MGLIRWCQSLQSQRFYSTFSKATQSNWAQITRQNKGPLIFLGPEQLEVNAECILKQFFNRCFHSGPRKVYLTISLSRKDQITWNKVTRRLSKKQACFTNPYCYKLVLNKGSYFIWSEPFFIFHQRQYKHLLWNFISQSSSENQRDIWAPTT